MNRQQNLPTESNAPEQAATEHGTLLSPWMQRRFARLSARNRGIASTAQPLTLIGRASRPVGTTLTEPRIGALHPLRLERFSRAITARAQTTHLVGIHRPTTTAITATPAWESEIEMILPGGAPAATGQIIERFASVTPGTFTVGQPIEPFRPTPTAPDRSTRPAAARPTRQPARAPTKKEFPAQTRRYTRVEEITPQGEAPANDEWRKANAEQRIAGMPETPGDTVAPITTPRAAETAPSASAQRTPEPPPGTMQAATPQPREPARVAAKPAAPIPAPPVIQRQTAPALPTPQTPRPVTPLSPPESRAGIAAPVTSASRSEVSPPRTTQPETPERPLTSPQTIPHSTTPPATQPPTPPESVARPPRAIVEPLRPAQARPPRALPVEPPPPSRIQRRAAEHRPAPPVAPQMPRPAPETRASVAKPVAAPEAREPAPPVGIQRAPESPMAQRQAQSALPSTQTPVTPTQPVQTPQPVRARGDAPKQPPMEAQPPSRITTLLEPSQPVTPPTIAPTATAAPPVIQREPMPTPATPQTPVASEIPRESPTPRAATEPSGEETTLPLRQIIQRRAETRRHGLVRTPASLPIVRPIAAAPRQARPEPPQPPAPVRAAAQFQADVADKLHVPTTPGAPAVEPSPTPSPAPQQPLATTRRPLLTVTTSPALYARSPNLFIGPGRAPTVSQKRATRQMQPRAGEPLPPDDAQAAMHALLHPETPLILPPSPRPTPARATTAPPSPPPITAPPERVVEPGVMPLARQPERQPASFEQPAPPVQPAPPPTRAAELVAQPTIVGELIQREPAVQRAETEETAPEPIDLTALARRVYPFVKRLIAIERERGAR